MSIWFDFGAVVITAPSNEGKDAVGAYADEKFKKYEDLVKVICGQGNGQFYPVIVDHFGTPHRPTLNFITSIAAFYRDRFVGSPVEAPMSPLEVYRLLLETIATELARGNFVRSNKWNISHALSPQGAPPTAASYRGPVGANGAPLSEAFRIDPSCPDGAHGNCAFCPKALGALTAQDALMFSASPNHRAVPAGGLAHATEARVPRSATSSHPALAEGPDPARSTIAGPATAPTLAAPTSLPPPTMLKSQTVDLLSTCAPRGAQRLYPGHPHGRRKGFSGGARERTRRPRKPAGSCAQPLAQRACAARWRVNHTAAARQSAATVPRREGPSGCPNQVRLLNTRAPRGA